MRRPLIAGNWKMFHGPADTKRFFTQFLSKFTQIVERDIAIFPPFVSLQSALCETSGSPVRIGAQNMHWENSGAFTGEISPLMLKELGVAYVLVGHSERRELFREIDADLNKKVHAALNHNIIPVLCIGEVASERQGGLTYRKLESQLHVDLAGLTPQHMKNVVIAYEPVWAIGTGLTATPQIAQEAHCFIRQELARMFNESVATETRILYGGSVKPNNSGELVIQPDIDGLLVGGASLDPESFYKICIY